MNADMIPIIERTCPFKVLKGNGNEDVLLPDSRSP